MTEKLYRIKPLVWVFQNVGNSWRAHTEIGSYTVIETLGGAVWSHRYGEWVHLPSLGQAKAFAEAHYRDRLLQCLEEIS